MASYIRVTSADKTCTWEKLGSSSDLEEIRGLLATSRKVFDLFESLLVPVRTNNLKNFAIDFFLPTSMHYNPKECGFERISHVALVTLAWGLLDVVTHPIRIFTCIPRILYNQKQEETPFHKYLVSQGDVDPRILDSEHVQVEWVFIEGCAYKRQGIEAFDYAMDRSSHPINFIETRFYPREESNGFMALKGAAASRFPESLQACGITDPKVIAHLTPKALVGEDHRLEEVQTTPKIEELD